MSILSDFAEIASGGWSTPAVSSSLSVPLSAIPWDTLGGLTLGGQALPDLSKLTLADFKPDVNLGGIPGANLGNYGGMTGLDGGALGRLSDLKLTDFMPGGAADQFTAGPVSETAYAIDNSAPAGLPNVGLTGAAPDGSGMPSGETGSAGGGGKMSDFVGKAMSALKPMAPAAAMMLLNKLMGKDTGEAAEKAEERLNKSADMATNTAEGLIKQYQSGKINANDLYQIEQWYKNAIGQVDAFYSKAGISDSTAHAEARRNVEAQKVALMDAARQGLLTQGLQALNIGNGPLGAAMQVAASADQNASNAQSAMLQSLGMLMAMQSNPQAYAALAAQQQAAQPTA